MKNEITMDVLNKVEDKCSNCNGTGKQVFHGHFESVIGICNFCQGTGKKEDQIRCLEDITRKCK